jgi:hypothetical protein
VTKEQALFLDDHADDIYGLWEILVYQPQNTELNNKNEIMLLVIDLVSQGLLGVFKTNNAADPGSPLDAYSAIEAVKNAVNWTRSEKSSSEDMIYIKESIYGAEMRIKEHPNI